MAHESAKDRGHRMLREAGYASGGDVAQDRKMITKAIRQHETQEHGGKHSTLKLAKGGHVRKRADGGSTTDRAPIDLNPSELGAMENAAAVAEKRDRAQYPDKLHKSITSTYPAVAAQRIARKKYGQEDIGTVDDKRSVEIGDAFAKRAKKNADDEGPVYKPDDDYAPKGFKAGGRTKGKVQKRADGGAIRKPATTVNVIVAAGGKGQGASDETNMRRSIQAGMHAAPPAPPPDDREDDDNTDPEDNDQADPRQAMAAVLAALTTAAADRKQGDVHVNVALPETLQHQLVERLEIAGLEEIAGALKSISRDNAHQMAAFISNLRAEFQHLADAQQNLADQPLQFEYDAAGNPLRAVPVKNR